MLVDHSFQQQPSYFTDLSDFLHADIFSAPAQPTSSDSPSSSSSSASRASSPHFLLTPPQSTPPSSFADIASDQLSAFNQAPGIPTGSASTSYFNFLDDDLKPLDNLALSSSAPYDFSSAFGSDMDMGVDMSMGIAMNSIDMSNFALPAGPLPSIGIDPQLVGTPASAPPSSDFEDAEHADDEDSPAAASPPKPKEKEKLTLTIAPIKVGGHGKARRGTVQSGGIVKKSSASPGASAAASANKDKENASAAPPPQPKKQKPSPPPDADDDDDELPQDWRPSPEVFAKMTSKEKRQLRNKISARNFRVRRKEYISTLEGDIAERDRLLDAIRSELGSTQSENLALRQEIATLKKNLLEGRGVLNLPPPAPLPAQSAAVTLAAQAASSSNTATPSPPLLTPNTQKDLPTSPRIGAATRGFWGGIGGNVGGGGITPVHRAMVPEVSLAQVLKENINPALNGRAGATGPQQSPQAGFDGFADLNPFTMKTLDAYRMHLWGRMAQQHHAHQQQQNSQQSQQPHQPPLPSGLVSGMRPHFFAASPGTGPLATLLSGKGAGASTGAYPSPPASPHLGPKARAANDKDLREREKERETAVYAALASQTLLKKLGSAFWDAFSGSSGSSPVSNSASTPSAMRAWDADKVRRVLEGKAVVRVVDVDDAPAPPRVSAVASASVPAPTPAAPAPPHTGAQRCEGGKCAAAVVDILEESMRSLSLGRKA